MSADYIDPLTYEVTDDTSVCPRMRKRIRDGLWIEEGHCPLCAERVRSCKTNGYRIRDSNGRIITADWVLTP